MPSSTHLPAQYIDLVYAAALRQTHHDPHTAADVTQAVFLIMLQKAQAHRLPEEAHMAGWLLKVTHFAVKQARRAAQRRANHESRAARAPAGSPALASHASPAASTPTEIAEVLDTALLSLSASDREILARRFLQDQPIAAVAAAVGISENTAGHRIARALEKLRKILSRRGILAPAAALTALLAAQSAHAAPPALLATLTAAAGTSAAAAALAKSTSLMLKLATLKTAAALILLILTAGVGTGLALSALEGHNPETQRIRPVVQKEQTPGLAQLVRWDVILNDAGADQLRALATPVPTASKVYQAFTGLGADFRALVRENPENLLGTSNRIHFADEWPPPGDKLQLFQLGFYAELKPDERVNLLGTIDGPADQIERLAAAPADRLRLTIAHPQMSLTLDELTTRGWTHASPVAASLQFSGELAAGHALAFLGTFRAASGTPYHHLVVWEAFTAQREQMTVIARQSDVTWWCGHGLEPLQKWANAARAWTATADHERSAVPPGFEKALEDGKTLRLVALCRPSQWPFCWWDARGNPVEGMNSMLPLDGDPPEGLFALVEVEGKPDEYQLALPTSKGFVPPPVAKYISWESIEVQDERKLEVGVVVGPWKELKRLQQDEPFSSGGVDYLITLGNAFGDTDFLVHFQQNGILDNQDQLVPVTSDGRAAESDSVSEIVYGAHDFTQSRETQPNFHGLPFKDITAYRLMQRRRQWVTLEDFATKPNLEPPTDVTPAAAAEAERLRDQRLVDKKLRELQAKRQAWANIVPERTTEMGTLRIFIDALKKGDAATARSLLTTTTPQAAPILDPLVQMLIANETARALAVRHFGEIPVLEKLQHGGWLSDTESELLTADNWTRTPDGTLESHGLQLRKTPAGYVLNLDRPSAPDAAESFRHRLANLQTLTRLLTQTPSLPLDTLLTTLKENR
jgi:RNA polymerase sigma factor (sigma-70 family)